MSNNREICKKICQLQYDGGIRKKTEYCVEHRKCIQYIT